MEQAIQLIYDYPLTSVIAISTAGILFVIIIKKLIKLMAIVLTFAALYLGYIAYTGQNISFFDDKLIHKGRKEIIKLKDRSIEAKERLFSEILKNK